MSNNNYVSIVLLPAAFLPSWVIFCYFTALTSAGLQEHGRTTETANFIRKSKLSLGPGSFVKSKVNMWNNSRGNWHNLQLQTVAQWPCYQENCRTAFSCSRLSYNTHKTSYLFYLRLLCLLLKHRKQNMFMVSYNYCSTPMSFKNWCHLKNI